MAGQKADTTKGSAFIPPPTAGQTDAAKREPAKTLVMQIGLAKPPAETRPEPKRSLKKTLLGLPAVAPPAHQQEKIDSAALWASAGLVPREREEKEEAAPQPEEVFDRLLGFRRGLHPKNVEMLDFVILQMEAEFRMMVKSEKLQPISSGGRAFLDSEEPVANSVGKIRDEVFRRFAEDGELGPFLRHFVDVVLSSAPVTEHEGKNETEMRNGFYRAVAWCLCAHSNPEQLVSYMLKNHISLIDGVGISAGLSSSDSVGPDFARNMMAMLLERKWVSHAFYDLQEMVKQDLDRLANLEKEGKDTEEAICSLYASMDILLMVVFREVEGYQTLGQKYTHLAMLLSNLSRNRETEVPVVYIAPSEFYSLILTRQLPVSRVWEDLGHTHKFIAERMANRGDGKSQYVVGLRPKDLAQRFFTILEAVDFLTKSQKVKDLALKMIGDFHAPFSQDPKRNEAFKKIVALTLFTKKEDLERHASLFSTLEDPSDPIISLRASEHREMLLTERKDAANEPEDPFANIGDEDRF